MSRSSAASRLSSAAFSWFDTRAVPVMRRFGELPFVTAVRDALPWSFVGLLVAFAVIAALGLRGPTVAGASLGLRIASALLPAFGVMSAVLTVLLATRISKTTNYRVVPMLLGSAIAFSLSLPRPFGPNVLAYLRVVGATGLFVAILACGVTAGAIAVARRWVRSPIADWVGAALTVAAFAALALAGVSIAGGIAAAMQPIAHLGDTYVALIVIVLVQTLLWTAGVHGPAVLAGIVTPVYLTMQMRNAHAFAAHAPLPYVVVTSLFLFIFPGGAGATLPLAALLALSRIPRLRRIGKATLIPALFNINDPLILGAPIAFNPYLMIPFVIAPLVLATLTYGATIAGLIPRAAFYVPSSIPTLVSTYLATVDVRAMVLVCINIAIATAIYLPFVRAYERHLADDARIAPLSEASA